MDKAKRSSKRAATAKPGRGKSTQKSGFDRRKLNQGKVENLQPFKSREENGGQLDPRINVGGRPKLLSDAYRVQLAKPMPGDAEGRTYAEVIAWGLALAATKESVSAAREIRQATEGERIRTWRDDIIDLLRDGTLTPEQVSSELGDDLAAELIAASGIRRGESGKAETAGDTTAES